MLEVEDAEGGIRLPERPLAGVDLGLLVGGGGGGII